MDKKEKEVINIKDMTSEQIEAHIAKLEADKAELAENNKTLEKEAKKSAKAAAEASKPKEYTFEVEETDEEGEETGKTLKYKYVVPKFDLDGTIYTAEEASKKPAVCAKLVAIGSGIVQLVEEAE